MICNKCCFFATNSFNDRMGVCKRYPSERNKSFNDWCGEFKEVVEIVKNVEQVTQKRGRKNANQGTEQ